MILVSACLAGTKCRYNGKDKASKLIVDLKAKGKVTEVCPEVLAGLPTPRVPCEIVAGDGNDVLKGQAMVLNQAGEDITEKIISGCERALAAAKKENIKLAVLKTKSVCCGKGQIYDGSFSGRLIEGDGILTVMLRQNGIRVIDSQQFEFVEQLKNNKNTTLGF